ncbi:MAG: hypothetical protein QM724_07410 [Flavobacteriales bacterium]
MILYLTHNDQPSGVYWSQVTDVVAHLNTLGGERVRLVALVSARGFLRTRRSIRAHAPDALVLPMVPRMERWRANAAIVAGLCRLLRPEGIICRGIFATWMALRARDKGLTKRVCFDGRGAYAAEWEEYRLIDNDALIAQFRPTEQEAVRRSDIRLAVSEALIQHWRERYCYTGREHVVVPCALGRDHAARGSEQQRQALRKELGVGADDVLLVYAGSVAGWQSFTVLRGLLDGWLAADPRVRMLFLSAQAPEIEALKARYPGRVFDRWVRPAEVHGLLEACDHGLLLRADTLTNRVSSPTKFAEYLAAGLPVIVSPGIGDFSALVERERLGRVVRAGETSPVPGPTPAHERERLQRYARERLSKSAFDAEYRRLLNVLST